MSALIGPGWAKNTEFSTPGVTIFGTWTPKDVAFIRRAANRWEVWTKDKDKGDVRWRPSGTDVCRRKMRRVKRRPPTTYNWVAIKNLRASTTRFTVALHGDAS